MSSPDGQDSRMAGCVIPEASRRATTRRPGGRAARGRLAVASRAAPGPPRGRALPGRRDDARAPAWLSGAIPERTSWEPPSRPESHEHERAAQDARGGTGRHQPGACVRVHTEEVTGSLPVSPTSTGRRPGGIGYAQIQRETERTQAGSVAGQCLRRAPIHSRS